MSCGPGNDTGQGGEIGMRKLTIFLVFLFTLVGCGTKEKTLLADSESRPDAFCKVIRQPAPLLMGIWECSFARYPDKSRPDENYVKYQLVEYDQKYALHFYRTWKGGRKMVTVWKEWTINGQEILGDPEFELKIFVQGEDVYFTIRGLHEPVKMSRVKN